MMRRSTAALAATAVLALVAAAGPAAAQPAIYNGMFDLAVTAEGAGGWTPTNNWGGWYSDVGNPAPGYYLNGFGEVETDPTISQVVTGFVPGTDYTLRGDYSNDWAGGSPAGSFVVYLDGTPIFTGGQSGGGWLSFAVTFTATAATHEIAIASEVGGSDHSYFIDNVMFEGQVPAGSTAFGQVKAMFR